jgi:hypothetical protein
MTDTNLAKFIAATDRAEFALEAISKQMDDLLQEMAEASPERRKEFGDRFLSLMDRMIRIGQRLLDNDSAPHLGVVPASRALRAEF